jgi:hypothetical protein
LHVRATHACVWRWRAAARERPPAPFCLPPQVLGCLCRRAAAAAVYHVWIGGRYHVPILAFLASGPCNSAPAFPATSCHVNAVRCSAQLAQPRRATCAGQAARIPPGPSCRPQAAIRPRQRPAAAPRAGCRLRLSPSSSSGAASATQGRGALAPAGCAALPSNRDRRCAAAGRVACASSRLDGVTC